MTQKAVNALTRIVRCALRRREVLREGDEERDHADRVDDRQQRDQRLQQIHDPDRIEGCAQERPARAGSAARRRRAARTSSSSSPSTSCTRASGTSARGLGKVRGVEGDTARWTSSTARRRRRATARRRQRRVARGAALAALQRPAACASSPARACARCRCRAPPSSRARARSGTARAAPGGHRAWWRPARPRARLECSARARPRRRHAAEGVGQLVDQRAGCPRGAQGCVTIDRAGTKSRSACTVSSRFSSTLTSTCVGARRQLGEVHVLGAADLRHVAQRLRPDGCRSPCAPPDAGASPSATTSR